MRGSGLNKEMLAPPDTSWFDEDPEHWLSRDDFRAYETAAKVSLRALLSKDYGVIRATQEHLSARSITFNEIRKVHAGYGFPVFMYTHDPALFWEDVTTYDPSTDLTILCLDMGDSLRRRHIAVSHVILPRLIRELREEFRQPLVIKNLGCGIGLDTLRAAVGTNDHLNSVKGYDTCESAIRLGEQIARHLGQQGCPDPSVFSWHCRSFTESRGKCHLAIMVGIICGLQDRAAKVVLRQAWRGLQSGGKLLVSSSNNHMRCTDPLPSFLIQHCGTLSDPREGWGLSFRTAETMVGLLEGVGFRDVELHDDANVPGYDALPDEIKFGVEILPAKAQGRTHSGNPLALPPREVLDRRIGYNWLAVATK